MNPIFNEYITFLRDTSGESLPDLKEGYFWLDRQIVKGFDKQGNIHKFYRINISDSLKLSFYACFYYIILQNPPIKHFIYYTDNSYHSQLTLCNQPKYHTHHLE